MQIKNEGYIFQIQNFSVNDGDGIRTTIFMSGCPLDCIWCCNPEQKNTLDRGHIMTAAQVEEQVERQAAFFRRCSGGITFSGGEATMQAPFLRAMVNRFFDKGYNLALETSGYFYYTAVADILQRMDTIFVDIKHIDCDKHRMFTGVDNTRILDNIIRIKNDTNARLVVRIPLIEGVNADEDNIYGTMEFLRSKAGGALLEFLPYHKLGEDKYRKMNIKLPDDRYRELYDEGLTDGKMHTPAEEKIEKYKRIAGQYGIQTISFK